MRILSRLILCFFTPYMASCAIYAGYTRLSATVISHKAITSQTSILENNHKAASAFIKGKLEYENKNYTQAIMLLRSCINPVVPSSATQDIEAYYLLGKSYYAIGHLQIALSFHKKSLRLSKNTSNIAFKEGDLYAIGDIFASLGSLNKAKTYYKNGEELFNTVKLISVTRFLQIGDSYSKIKDHAKALKYYLLALDAYKTPSHVGNFSLKSLILDKISLAYVVQGLYLEALNMYASHNYPLNKIDILRLKTLNTTIPSDTQLIILQLYKEKNNLSSMRQYNNFILKIESKLHNNLNSPLTVEYLYMLAELYYKLGIYDKSLSYIDKSLQESEDIESPLTTAMILGLAASINIRPVRKLIY